MSARPPDELSERLRAEAKKSRVARGKIIRDQLDKARAGARPELLLLAGSVNGPADLSERKGFSRK